MPRFGEPDTQLLNSNFNMRYKCLKTKKIVCMKMSVGEVNFFEQSDGECEYYVCIKCPSCGEHHRIYIY